MTDKDIYYEGFAAYNRGENAIPPASVALLRPQSVQNGSKSSSALWLQGWHYAKGVVEGD